LTDELTALYITRHDHYGHAGRKVNAELNDQFRGPKVVLYDIWRAHGWDILTHAGYVTYVHHDTAGFVTGVYPRSGAKLWGYFYLKKEYIPKSRKELFTLYDGLFDVETFHDSIGLATVLIEEGDFL
jgi:hypothetical protein